MIDLGVYKLALIGVVALIVLGPQKLPRVARTLGALLGKAQRYVADVKAEVNKAIELEEIQKIQETVREAAQDVHSSIESSAADFEKSWAQTTQGLASAGSAWTGRGSEATGTEAPFVVPPQYRHPNKKWRVKKGALPQWYKERTGVRRQALSGAARVARYRPRPVR